MKVAIFSLTKDRDFYTEGFLNSLNEKTNFPFDHYVLDQGSSDNNLKILKEIPQLNGKRIIFSLKKNIGINRGVNFLIDKIGDDADIIIKLDPDMEIETENWLIECLKSLQPKLLISPYIKGLIENRGGVNRVGVISKNLTQTPFIGGMCMIGLREAWDIKWSIPATLHPNGGDVDFCQRLSTIGYRFGYKENIIIRHQETSIGQKERYGDYFKLRKQERITRL